MMKNLHSFQDSAVNTAIFLGVLSVLTKAFLVVKICQIFSPCAKGIHCCIHNSNPLTLQTLTSFQHPIGEKIENSASVGWVIRV